MKSVPAYELCEVYHMSWKVLDFFLKIPGPGNSWKNVENHAFYIGSNGNHFLLALLVDCSPLLINLRCPYVIFRRS